MGARTIQAGGGQTALRPRRLIPAECAKIASGVPPGGATLPQAYSPAARKNWTREFGLSRPRVSSDLSSGSKLEVEQLGLEGPRQLLDGI